MKSSESPVARRVPPVQIERVIASRLENQLRFERAPVVQVERAVAGIESLAENHLGGGKKAAVSNVHDARSLPANKEHARDGERALNVGGGIGTLVGAQGDGQQGGGRYGTAIFDD